MYVCTAAFWTVRGEFCRVLHLQKVNVAGREFHLLEGAQLLSQQISDTTIIQKERGKNGRQWNGSSMACVAYGVSVNN